ncbi:PAS domain S-box protein [Exiguobacterium sp. SL14]|nr:PAS domain S-box protein [Exiguobacterium sp. SL14]MCY1691252.1 PAS domain S-box protein [Exiguobacterium sp. SL14]
MNETLPRRLLSPAILSSLEANVAMICFDRQRRVVDVNDLFAKTMKYKRDEMIGLQHHTFCTLKNSRTAVSTRIFGHVCFQASVQRIKSNVLTPGGHLVA